MGFELIALVREAALGPVQKLLLYALASRVDSRGRCWPSVDRLRRDTGLSRRAVQVHLGLLIACGPIERVANAGRSSEYQLDEKFLRASGAERPGSDGVYAGRQVVAEERMPCAPPAHVVRTAAQPARLTSAPHAPEVKREEPSNNQKLAGRAPGAVDNIDANAPWWRSKPRVMLMGAELGLTAAPAESYNRYKDRVYQAWRASLYQSRNTKSLDS